MAPRKAKGLKARSRRGKGFRRGVRRSRRGRRSQYMHYVETITFKLALGSTSNLTFANLKNRPKSCNFRVQYVHVVATSANDGKGNYIPSAIQLDMLDTENSTGTGTTQATTGPVLLGTMPRNVKIHSIRQAEWMPYSISNEVQFCTISSICLGKGEESASIHGIAHVLVRFGSEIITASCPPQHIETQPSAESDFVDVSQLNI